MVNPIKKHTGAHECEFFRILPIHFSFLSFHFRVCVCVSMAFVCVPSMSYSSMFQALPLRSDAFFRV